MNTRLKEIEKGLIDACLAGDEADVGVALAAGAGFGCDCLTPAVVGGSAKVVVKLLAHGVQITEAHRDTTHCSLLVNAAYGGNPKIVAALLATGEKWDLQAPLYECAKNTRAPIESVMSIAQLLIDAGADVSAENSEVLRLSIASGYPELVALFARHDNTIAAADEAIAWASAMPKPALPCAAPEPSAILSRFTIQKSTATVTSL